MVIRPIPPIMGRLQKHFQVGALIMQRFEVERLLDGRFFFRKGDDGGVCLTAGGYAEEQAAQKGHPSIPNGHAP